MKLSVTPEWLLPSYNDLLGYFIICDNDCHCLWQRLLLSVATLVIVRDNACVTTLVTVCDNACYCLWQLLLLAVTTLVIVCGNACCCLWQRLLLSVATLVIVRDNACYCVWQLLLLSVTTLVIVCDNACYCPWQLLLFQHTNFNHWAIRLVLKQRKNQFKLSVYVLKCWPNNMAIKCTVGTCVKVNKTDNWQFGVHYM